MEKSLGATSEKASNYIPADLTFSILSKLPLKSLKRFGCVHKSWVLLFENPKFVSIFYNNFITNNNSYHDDTIVLLHQSVLDLHLLCGERFENKVNFVLPNPFQENPYFHILDSSGITGIICLYQGPHRAVLWNPATEELKIIPPSPVEPLSFWDTARVTIYGVGYDLVRDDYKLLRRLPYPTGVTSVSSKPHDVLWEIYSLRSNSWKQLVVNVPTVFAVSSTQQIYIAGMCHCVGQSTTHNDESECLLSSFDLSNEVFFTTPITLNIDDNLFLNLVLLNGSIALISWYLGTTTFHISILGELGVKESWTKLFTVGPLPGFARPIGAGKNGEIFFLNNDELVRFDLNTQLIEELGVEVTHTCSMLIYKKTSFCLEE